MGNTYQIMGAGVIRTLCS